MSVDPLNFSNQDISPREWLSAIALQAFLETDHSDESAIRLSIQYADALLETIKN